MLLGLSPCIHGSCNCRLCGLDTRRGDAFVRGLPRVPLVRYSSAFTCARGAVHPSISRPGVRFETHHVALSLTYSSFQAFLKCLCLSLHVPALVSHPPRVCREPALSRSLIKGGYTAMLPSSQHEFTLLSVIQQCIKRTAVCRAPSLLTISRSVRVKMSLPISSPYYRCSTCIRREI